MGRSSISVLGPSVGMRAMSLPQGRWPVYFFLDNVVEVGEPGEDPIRQSNESTNMTMVGAQGPVGVTASESSLDIS